MKVVVLLLLLSLGSPGLQAQCIAFEADTVSLSGQLVRRVYPGRPNYESVRAGDEPDTVLVLELSRAICLTASAHYGARTGIREVQLFLTEADTKELRGRLGMRIQLSGILRGADLGWHHLPVVFWAKFPPPRPKRVAVVAMPPNEEL